MIEFSPITFCPKLFFFFMFKKSKESQGERALKWFYSLFLFEGLYFGQLYLYNSAFLFLLNTN